MLIFHRRRPFAPATRAATLLAATLLAAFIALFAWPQSAAAHDALVGSSPADGSTVERLPDELTLTFSAALISGEGTTAVEVRDAEGNSVTDGEPSVDGAMVTQPLVSEAMAGQYHALWKVVSSDGHETDGQFCFIVTTSTVAGSTGDAGPVPTTCSSEPPAAAESGSPTGWIWTGVAAGILVIAAIVAWLVTRARRGPANSDSDTPTER